MVAGLLEMSLLRISFRPTITSLQGAVLQCILVLRFNFLSPLTEGQ